MEIKVKIKWKLKWTLKWKWKPNEIRNKNLSEN